MGLETNLWFVTLLGLLALQARDGSQNQSIKSLLNNTLICALQTVDV